VRLHSPEGDRTRSLFISPIHPVAEGKLPVKPGEMNKNISVSIVTLLQLKDKI
jgi:hypothetical protein